MEYERDEKTGLFKIVYKRIQCLTFVDMNDSFGTSFYKLMRRFPHAERLKRLYISYIVDMLDYTNNTIGMGLGRNKWYSRRAGKLKIGHIENNLKAVYFTPVNYVTPRPDYHIPIPPISIGGIDDCPRNGYMIDKVCVYMLPACVQGDHRFDPIAYGGLMFMERFLEYTRKSDLFVIEFRDAIEDGKRYGDYYFVVKKDVKSHNEVVVVDPLKKVLYVRPKRSTYIFHELCVRGDPPTTTTTTPSVSIIPTVNATEITADTTNTTADEITDTTNATKTVEDNDFNIDDYFYDDYELEEEVEGGDDDDVVVLFNVTSSTTFSVTQSTTTAPTTTTTTTTTTAPTTTTTTVPTTTTTRRRKQCFYWGHNNIRCFDIHIPPEVRCFWLYGRKQCFNVHRPKRDVSLEETVSPLPTTDVSKKLEKWMTNYRLEVALAIGTSILFNIVLITVLFYFIHHGLHKSSHKQGLSNV